MYVFACRGFDCAGEPAISCDDIRRYENGSSRCRGRCVCCCAQLPRPVRIATRLPDGVFRALLLLALGLTTDESPLCKSFARSRLFEKHVLAVVSQFLGSSR